MHFMNEPFPEFSEPIGLFPLPNVVLLPGGTLPLQIYEPRYRTMVRDALNEQPVIAMALLRAGYEPYYYTNLARIYPIVCVGRIREHVKTPDGRYFLNLAGICRARVREENRSGTYRRALLEPMIPAASVVATDGEYAARNLLQKVVSAPVFDDLPHIKDCREMIASDVPLGDLTDRLAADLLPLDAVEIRQHILEEMDVFRRTGTLLNELRVLLEKRNLRRNRHDDDGRPRESMN
jgi:Lon protease-like protein